MIGNIGHMVIALALVLGGRFERLMGLAMLAGSVARLGIIIAWPHEHSWLAQSLVQMLVLAVFVWIALRHRPGWLLAVIVLHALSTLTLFAGALEFELTGGHRIDLASDPAYSLVALTKYAVLLWGLSLRWLSPPRPLPTTRDLDLLTAAG